MLIERRLALSNPVIFFFPGVGNYVERTGEKMKKNHRECGSLGLAADGSVGCVSTYFSVCAGIQL